MASRANTIARNAWPRARGARSKARRDRLKQCVFLQHSRQVEHGVSRGIETRQQLRNYDQNVGLFPLLEGFDDSLVVRRLVAVTLHHGFSEPLDLVGGGFVDSLFAFAIVWR